MSAPLTRSVLGSSQKGNAHRTDELDDSCPEATPAKRAPGLSKSVGGGTPGSAASRGKRWQAPTMSSLAKVVGSIRSVGRGKGKRQRGKLPVEAGDIDPFMVDGREKENIDPFANETDYLASLLIRSTYASPPPTAGVNVEAAFALARSAPASSIPMLDLPDSEAGDAMGDFVLTDSAEHTPIKGGPKKLLPKSTSRPTLSFRHSAFQPFALGFDPANPSNPSALDAFPAALAASLALLPGASIPSPKRAPTSTNGSGTSASQASDPTKRLTIDWDALDERAEAPVEVPDLFRDLEMDEEGRARPASTADIIASVPGGEWRRYAAVRVREL